MSKTVYTRLVEQTDTYVEIARRYPLWPSIPADQRMTLERMPALQPAYRAALVERITNPESCCLVAVRVYNPTGLYAPCHYPVVPGARLCHAHGGPSVLRQPESVSALRAERDALAAEVAALKAQLAPPDGVEVVEF